jgi:hypothetical protein
LSTFIFKAVTAHGCHAPGSGRAPPMIYDADEFIYYFRFICTRLGVAPRRTKADFKCTLRSDIFVIVIITLLLLSLTAEIVEHLYVFLTRGDGRDVPHGFSNGEPAKRIRAAFNGHVSVILGWERRLHIDDKLKISKFIDKYS